MRTKPSATSYALVAVGIPACVIGRSRQSRTVLGVVSSSHLGGIGHTTRAELASRPARAQPREDCYRRGYVLEVSRNMHAVMMVKPVT
jgi:hypothetical protein